MNRATSTLQPPTGRHLVTSVVTLALWRWRQHWFLLLMTGLGMIAAMIIACAVPLLSQTMLTAGLRGVLRASPTSSEITLTDRKSTRLNSSHQIISYAVFCLKKKKNKVPSRMTHKHMTHVQLSR